jgi:ketosteroid isomerase-like protein
LTTDADQIRDLNHRYCWCFDAADLEGLVSVFTDDAVCDLGPFGTWRGIAEIRAGFAAQMIDSVPGGRLHSVSNDLIDVHGDTATGRWYLVDYDISPGSTTPVRIVAHCAEEYRRVDGRWLIRRTALQIRWRSSAVFGTRTAKSISQFLPVSGLTREAADRHYREVHTRFARTELRGMPHVRSYHTNRADAEFDVAGGWSQPPRAFRFVLLRFAPGRSLEFPVGVRARVAEDHRNFLRELRGFAVDEQVLTDRLAGQTALVKYLFEYERPPAIPVGEGEAVLDGLTATLAEAAQDTDRAFGPRRVVVNRVRTEAVAEPIDEPGQRPTDRILPETTKHAFVELWFDNRDWAEEWFARPAVRAALLRPWWALASGYRVTEECGLDRG